MEVLDARNEILGHGRPLAIHPSALRFEEGKAG